MMDPGPEIGFSMAEIARAVLIGLGSVTLWLLKKLGDKHVTTLEEVMKKQDLILHKISGTEVRLAVLESRVDQHLHRTSPLEEQ